MNVLSTEADAFIRAADVVGLELPATVKEAVAGFDGLMAQIASLPRPEPVMSAARLVAEGTPLEKVNEKHAKLVEVERKKAALRDTANQAQELAALKVSFLVAQVRDDLIRALRPIVTGLIEEARPLAEALTPFAPKYEPGAIVRRATSDQIDAWRGAEELEAQFGVCIAAWRAAITDTTRLGGTPSPARADDFDLRWVDQAHLYWEWPARVVEPRLNGTYYAPHRAMPSTIRPTLLAVACERPECGFRLATVREMSELYRNGARDFQSAGGGWRFNTTPVSA